MNYRLNLLYRNKKNRHLLKSPLIASATAVILGFFLLITAYCGSHYLHNRLADEQLRLTTELTRLRENNADLITLFENNQANQEKKALAARLEPNRASLSLIISAIEKPARALQLRRITLNNEQVLSIEGFSPDLEQAALYRLALEELPISGAVELSEVGSSADNGYFFKINLQLSAAKEELIDEE